MCDGRVLLEEVLALPAVGVALHRERPVAQVRHEDGRDVAVEREQVALGDPLVRPERLVEVRQLQHRAPRGGSRTASARARRPPRRPAYRRAGRGTPARAAGRRASTRRTRSRPRASARPRSRRRAGPSASSAPRANGVVRSMRAARSSVSRRSSSRSVKPGADVAGIAQAVGGVHAEHERADPARAAALAAREAGDDELLAAASASACASRVERRPGR